MSRFSVLALAFANAIDSTMAAADDDLCRVLVLSGGATYGAWQTGILWGLANYSEDESEFYYDVLSGVSAGSINSAALSLWAPEQLKESAQWLSDTWASVSNHDIWRLWGETTALSIIQGCLTEAGCLDDSPGLAFLKDLFSTFPEGYKRRVSLGTANVENGDYVVWDQKSVEFEDLYRATLASGSIPAVFAPQHFQGMVLMDGGTIHNVNVPSAVEQCLEIVDDESKIVVDIAICGVEKNGGFEPGKSYENWQSARDLTDLQHGINNISWELRAYPTVNFRYLFYMEEAAQKTKLLDFRNETTWPMQEDGRRQAQETLAMGEGTGFMALKDWVANEKEMEKEWGTFGQYLRSFFTQN